jgi:hypothetical protein
LRAGRLDINKEVRRNDFVNLIEAIERDEIVVVIICGVDHLTRNLPDWSRFEKAARSPAVRPRPVPLARKNFSLIHSVHGSA